MLSLNPPQKKRNIYTTYKKITLTATYMLKTRITQKWDAINQI